MAVRWLRAGLALGCISGCTAILGDDFEVSPSGVGAGAGGPTSSSGSNAGGGAEGGGTTGKVLGAACDEDDACASGACADGVCCDDPCDEVCAACGGDGVCGQVVLGLDPRDDCQPGVCDGEGACVVGATIWARQFGGVETDQLTDLAVASDERILVVGTHANGFDLGGPTLAGEGVFVAALDAGGGHLFSSSIAGSQVQEPRVAAGPDGALAVAFSFSGSIGTPQAPESAGQGDLFLAKLGETGVLAWERHYGGVANEAVDDVAVAPDGRIALVAISEGRVSLGDQTLGHDDQDALLVAVYDASGAHLWSRDFGHSFGGFSARVAFDASGNLLLGGWFRGAIGFGGANFTRPQGTDTFVAKLDPNGNHLWSKSFGADGSFDKVEAIGVGADGQVVVAGTYDAGQTIGPSTLPAGGGAFVLAVDGADGEVAWVHAMTGGVHPVELAVDGAGEVTVVGELSRAADLGAGPIAPDEGSADVFLVRLDALGEHLHSRFTGNSADQFARGVGVDGVGNVVVGGYFSGIVTFGEIALSAPGENNDNLFLAKLTR